LARIYDVIPNYGISIIVLTLLIRLVLFPLGMKQIKSMQHMQAIQPKVKELQKKYKNNKQKAQEETMRLYKEAGVNPLGGCLPVLAQFPILIAMYAVIRAPALEPTPAQALTSYTVKNNHLPVDSQLFADTITHEHTSLVIVNLQCSAAQAGTQAPINDTERNQVVPGKPLLNADGAPLESSGGQAFTSKATMNCGHGGTAKIAYIALLLFMVGTTFFQQRQMQKASPPGAASQQQQAILKIMPLFFGFIGFSFPAGLVLYWCTSNLFQIGQQTFLLRAGHIGPDALERRMAEQRAKQGDKPATQKKGFISSMLQRAEEERNRRDTPGGSPKKGSSGAGSKGGGSPSRGGGSSGGGTSKGRGKSGGSSGSSGSGRGNSGRGNSGRGGAGRRGSGGGSKGNKPSSSGPTGSPENDPGGDDDSGD